MNTVLAVQLPAPCPLACAFCRTPQHGTGNSEAVLESVLKKLPGHAEIYLTSNGETGLSRIFKKIVDFAQTHGIGVSVLCATEKSIVPGLRRVEISLNDYTRPLAVRAIEKAKRLGVPVVISVVDDGSKGINPASIAEEHDACGVIVRALQHEGLSGRRAGNTRVYQKSGTHLGCFPAAAYAELERQEFSGYTTTCINHYGKTVPLLGSPA